DARQHPAGRRGRARDRRRPPPAGDPRRPVRRDHPLPPLAGLSRRFGLRADPDPQPLAQPLARALGLRLLVAVGLPQAQGQDGGELHQRLRGGHRPRVRQARPRRRGLRAHPPRRDPSGGRRGIHELRRLGGVLHGADRASRWQRPALPPGRRPEPGRRAGGARAGGMRILIVSDAWLPQVNGVVTSLRALVAELREFGHLVKVLSPQDFRHLPCPSYPEIPLAWDLWNVGPAIRDFRPDCVHLATEGPLGWAARRWLKRRGLAFSSAIHTRFPEYVHTRWPRIPL